MLSIFLALTISYAEEPAPSEPSSADAEITDHIEEVTVFADKFARWNGTRWYIKTEISHPLGMTFFAERNSEFRVGAFQIRTIIACDKDWKISKKSWQVSCKIEDFAIIVASPEYRGFTTEEMAKYEKKHKVKKLSERKLERAENIVEVLEEIDKKLTGAALQLQVRDDGRVTNIDLEGIEKNNRRESAIQETLRLVMSRVIVGFDMRLNKWNEIQDNVLWTEYTSSLMSMPVTQYNVDDGSLETIPSGGTSILLHRFKRMEGHMIVESIGRGSIVIDPLTWATNFTGVAAYDAHNGYMTERVWVLSGKPNASAGSVADYWHAGRVVQLAPEQKPSVGKTQLAAPRGRIVAELPEWPPLED